jgi:hypothetical protein
MASSWRLIISSIRTTTLSTRRRSLIRGSAAGLKE